MRTPLNTRRTTTSSIVASVVAGGCLCAALVACGDAGDGEGGPELVSGRIGSEVQSTATGDAPGAELSRPAPRSSDESDPLTGTQPKDVLPSEGAELSITEVRAGTHDDFDRIVVELDGSGSPGWKVAPDESDGGLEITVRGLKPSGSPEESPRVSNAANTEVTSVDVGGANNGSRRIMVGVKDASADYSVSLLSSPSRLVVDIIHS
ncbi:MAG: AMIN-like domain-containing (lipo)protein [Candidatus Corynebacterium faecigallinarum]